VKKSIAPMVTQKSEPTLGWIRVWGGSFHPAGNGSFGNIGTDYKKFSVDAGAPQLGFSATVWKIRSRRRLNRGRQPACGVLQAVNLKDLAAFIAKIAILPFRFLATPPNSMV
jgi:hypothetical protein